MTETKDVFAFLPFLSHLLSSSFFVLLAYAAQEIQFLVTTPCATLRATPKIGLLFIHIKVLSSCISTCNWASRHNWTFIQVSRIIIWLISPKLYYFNEKEKCCFFRFSIVKIGCKRKCCFERDGLMGQLTLNVVETQSNDPPLCVQKIELKYSRLNGRIHIFRCSSLCGSPCTLLHNIQTTVRVRTTTTVNYKQI